MQTIKFIILLILSYISSNIFAQDFEVSPGKIFFSIDPSESQSKIISIKNHSNFKTPFTITLADFLIDADGKKIVINRNSSKNSCTEWITLEKNFFTLNPNEQIELKITMRAPDEDYSARWAMLYIQNTKVKTSFDVDKGIGAAVNIGGRIAVQVYRTSVTKMPALLSVKHLLEKNNPDSEKREFSVTIENGGSSIEKCKLIYIASDLNSGEEFEFEPILFESFPGYPREIKFTLPETLPPGEYSLVALLDYGINTTIKGTRLKERLVILDKDK